MVQPPSPPGPVAARLERLTPDQRAAATSPPGPVLCVAPAGSGKTTTVVARLAWRVADGAHPGHVCALTFNRRAAEELQERADAALGEIGIAPGVVTVRTFHALGREILADAGIDVSRIVERTEVLQELAAGRLSVAGLRRLDDAFTRLKLDPERGPPQEDVDTHLAFAEYQRQLDDDGSIDLDDLVARAAPTLNADTRLLAHWRTRCALLFVDEAQDLDRAQLELALLLTGERRDIFLVGDDDQTIYAWRLADVRRVLGLAARLPGLRRVDLETNHRCAPEIVRRAARLVGHNRERFDKRIRPSPRASGMVVLLPDPGDALARARALLSIWPQQDPEARRAILARTNAELIPFAAVALELDMPYRIEVDGLLVDEPDLHAALGAAMSAPSAAQQPLLALRDAIAATALPTPLAAALLSWAAAFQDLEELRVELARRASARERLRQPDALLTLATIHGTKGLEWDHVACIGHDDGTFPSRRSITESPEPARALEEERRLAYVAWTRARRTLTLLYDPSAPSLFLREAFDADELDWHGSD